MRLLIVSDSHGRELSKVFAKDYPDCIVKIMLVGSTTDQVRDNYVRRQREAISFMPDNIILHVGHNDVVYHPYHNTSPRHIKDYFPDVMSFLRLLRERHAGSKLYYSTMLPRGVGRMLSEEQKIQ
jgi:lysophospholipase L1-like esterase